MVVAAVALLMILLSLLLYLYFRVKNRYEMKSLPQDDLYASNITTHMHQQLG
jgi:hypothetical protein